MSLDSLFFGLTHYFSFNEFSDGSGPVVRVDTFAGLTLADNDFVVSAAGKNSLALNFLAPEEKVLVSAVTDELSFARTKTFAVWVKPTGIIFGPGLVNYIVCKEDFGWVICIDHATRTLATWLYDVNGVDYTEITSYFEPAPAIPNGVWSLIIIWYDPIAKKLHCVVNDGPEVIATLALPTGPWDDASKILVGKAPGLSHAPFDGLIDELITWNRILTPAERIRLYKDRVGHFYPFPL